MQTIVAAIENVVRLIVDKPEQVKLEVIPQKDGSLLRVIVDPDDAGKVIGKQGRTARSLRTLLSAMGRTVEQTISLEIAE